MIGIDGMQSNRLSEKRRRRDIWISEERNEYEQRQMEDKAGSGKGLE